MLIVGIFLLSACNQVSDHLEQALEQAGTNRAELEKVLRHYRDDTLKYRAACFLIENMPYHSYKEGKALEQYRKYFSLYSEGNPMAAKRQCEVRLKNTGDAPLVIHGVDTSCGCTRVEYSKQPVRPGEETTLLIIYEADEAGHFHKTVDVYCNTADAPLRITVAGEAVKRN